MTKPWGRLAFRGLGMALWGLLWVSTCWASTDINTASEAELDGIKGIGPALSSKVLAARQQGAFQDWADLMRRVKGISSKNAAKLSAEGLTVQGLPFGAAIPAPPQKPSSTGLNSQP